MSRFDPYGDDAYQQLASIRAATQASVAFQALQTGLLAQMNGSMNGIHAEMAQVRQQQEEALAIHQELLNREQMQSHLEEFIFQAEKLVAECSKSSTDIPPSSRYFLLVGVLGKIEDEGIATSIIRGRDNKAAFEKVVHETQGLAQRLKKDPEVQQAIKWAEAERKRLELERQKAEERRQKTIAKLQQQVVTLQGQLQSMKALDVFKEHWAKLDAFLASKLVPWQKQTVQIVGGTFFVLIWPLSVGTFLFCWVDANKRNTEHNREPLEEIARINEQISALTTDAND